MYMKHYSKVFKNNEQLSNLATDGRKSLLIRISPVMKAEDQKTKIDSLRTI
jgi:hypothetical protein